MIANAMFYRAEDNKTQTAGVIQLGPIKFTMTQLYTSFISTLIVVPVNLIIVTIFRKAKLKHHGIFPLKKKGQQHVVKNQYWRRITFNEDDHMENDQTKNRQENEEDRKLVDRLGLGGGGQNFETKTGISTIDVQDYERNENFGDGSNGKKMKSKKKKFK
jgi:hypothetical protein